MIMLLNALNVPEPSSLTNTLILPDLFETSLQSVMFPEKISRRSSEDKSSTGLALLTTIAIPSFPNSYSIKLLSSTSFDAMPICAAELFAHLTPKLDPPPWTLISTSGLDFLYSSTNSSQNG